MGSGDVVVRKSVPALPDKPLSEEIVKLMAMDIGKDVCAYIRVMYPEAVTATSSTFLLSVRNSIYNNIVEAIKHHDEAEIRQWLEGHRKFRREWIAQWKKIREGHIARDSERSKVKT